MKYVDLVEAFDEHQAATAFLSTYNFDPGFFEKILLPSKALRKCRHIVVFMDEQRWRALCRSGFDSRALNRLYHVVPVGSAKGVFHPKLHLFLSDGRATLICGSHNLSNPGFTGNLELTTAIHVADGESRLTRPVWDALLFFQQVLDAQDQLHQAVARRWMPEVVEDFGWLAAGPGDDEVQLVHSLMPGGRGRAQNIWERLQEEWGEQLDELSVVSPFFDHDLGMLRDLKARYPSARVELTAQEHQTTLPTDLLAAEFSRYTLHALKSDARHLHGKLLSWRSNKRRGYLVGSANFTRPALKGANIEACLLVRTQADPCADLFDGALARKTTTAEAFTPGTEPEPGHEKTLPSDPLELEFATIDERGTLRLRLRTTGAPPVGTKVQLRQGGESAVSLSLMWAGDGREFRSTLDPAQTRIIRGAVLANLRSGTAQGPATYVLQEGSLERDVGMSGHDRATRRIEMTGEGLSEKLAELAAQEGWEAAIHFLMTVRIRFTDGARGVGRAGRFSLKARDPGRPEVAPDWLNDQHSQVEWCKALVRFADEHERRCLRRHAQRGNVNGIENFVDIFTTVIRILFEYHQKGVLSDSQMISWALKYVRIGCQGYEEPKVATWGFLSQIVGNLEGSSAELVENAKANGLAAHLRAGLLIAQVLRWTEKAKREFPSPRDCQPAVMQDLRKSLHDAEIPWATAAETLAALESYRVLAQDDLAQWASYLEGER